MSVKCPRQAWQLPGENQTPRCRTPGPRGDKAGQSIPMAKQPAPGADRWVLAPSLPPFPTSGSWQGSSCCTRGKNRAPKCVSRARHLPPAPMQQHGARPSFPGAGAPPRDHHRHCTVTSRQELVQPGDGPVLLHWGTRPGTWLCSPQPGRAQCQQALSTGKHPCP